MPTRWIFVAGPYTADDPVINTRNAILAGIDLRNRGYTPIVPHLFHLAHLVAPQPYGFWTDWDMDLLKRCDCLVRLPGESSGADAEVVRARELGLEVFDGLDSVLRR